MSLHPIKSRRKSRKAYSQLRAREEWKPWKGWNWTDTKKKGLGLFGRKAFVLSLIGLAVTIGFGAMYADANNSFFHSNGPNPNYVDPFTQLTRFSNLTDFNMFLAQSYGGCSPGPCIEMLPNSSFTSVVLSNNPITDLSTASTKELEIFQQFWLIIGSCCGSGLHAQSWGFYLTLNSTIPHTANYSPRNDPNVWMLAEMYATGGGNYAVYVYVKQVASDTIAIEDTGNCTKQSACFLQETAALNPTTGLVWDADLNYTGSLAPVNSACSNSVISAASGNSWFLNGGGSECSYEAITPGANPLANFGTSNFLPKPFMANGNFYLGLFQMSTTQAFNVIWNGNPFFFNIGLTTHQPTAAVQSPTIDSGGFFGPIIKALINIGVFILNGVLSFVAFITPALQTALGVLEGVIASILNFIGGLIGYPTAGTDLFTAINALLNFFGQASSIFSNVPALFSRFVNVNSIYFQWIPTALSIALNIATLGINSIGFVLTIIQFAFKLVAGVYLIILLTLFLVYTGDDSLGGILGFLETTQWLILGPLGWLARILNFILDIITSLIGLIPKPFVQMVAHAFPRIPIVETSARFVNPSFDLAAIRSGNMLAVWAWFVDFTFLAWYNGISPALPGSLGNLLPGMPATTFAALRGFLPVLEIFLIIISALAFIIWPANKMLSVFALDLDILDFEMSPGRKISQTGFGGGIHLKGGKKHFQAGLEKKVKGKKQKIELEREKGREQGRKDVAAIEERSRLRQESQHQEQKTATQRDFAEIERREKEAFRERERREQAQRNK